ncbi:serine hydrolase domain-containing protein [Paraburkholderia fungorum]|uniref:serine hydrolase domain-containing protein n=1 Tax=Paraburkholderia fungorum TaxID=134537 RepID=UPI00248E9001|nr:serine hydrolase domain-containing protein [Paraburkholderia fungorum]
MQSIEDSLEDRVVQGTCHPEFSRVRQAFIANFTRRGEVGAAVCVYLDGKPVVDLWGGLMRADTGMRWHRDTLVCMMSVTKGMLALCAHALVDTGQLSLDARVAEYWPEFGQASKDRITVRQLLSHQAALLFPDLAPPGSLLDWRVIVDALERQHPEWEPGTQGAYHSATYGHLVGELIRRASGGTTFPQVLARHFSGPLGADFQVGLTELQQVRAADIIENAGSTSLKAFADPTTRLGRAWRIRPRTSVLYYNSPVIRAAELGSNNGHGNARSVATIYAALAHGGELNGVRVLSEAAVDAMREEQWRGTCGMTGRHFRVAVGLFLNEQPCFPAGPNSCSFGHLGAGGAIGFADPHANLSFSYSPNAMCPGDGAGERCEALIDATYECLSS